MDTNGAVSIIFFLVESLVSNYVGKHHQSLEHNIIFCVELSILYLMLMNKCSQRALSELDLHTYDFLPYQVRPN